jgi:ElaB/YqjD/DUF883 family membrane-anchored ribosome-binding protein
MYLLFDSLLMLIVLKSEINAKSSIDERLREARQNEKRRNRKIDNEVKKLRKKAENYFNHSKTLRDRRRVKIFINIEKTLKRAKNANRAARVYVVNQLKRIKKFAVMTKKKQNQTMKKVKKNLMIKRF